MTSSASQGRSSCRPGERRRLYLQSAGRSHPDLPRSQAEAVTRPQETGSGHRPQQRPCHISSPSSRRSTASPRSRAMTTLTRTRTRTEAPRQAGFLPPAPRAQNPRVADLRKTPHPLRLRATPRATGAPQEREERGARVAPCFRSRTSRCPRSAPWRPRLARGRTARRRRCRSCARRETPSTVGGRPSCGEGHRTDRPTDRGRDRPGKVYNLTYT